MALDFVAGCIGGCAGVLVGHPFDTVKVKIQTQDFRNRQYKGALDCFSKTIRNESVSGLYKGMTSPLAGVAVVNAIIFGTYGNIQRRLPDPDSLTSHFIAGTAAGLIQSFICGPVELVKSRLQIQKQNAYKSSMHLLSHIYKTEGYRGVFRGLNITLLREGPGFGSYFVCYEWLTRTGSSAPISTPHMLFAGGTAGAVSWFLAYPIDVIKSRIQVDGMSGPRLYKNSMDCLIKSVKAEGISCLVRGLSPTLLRAFPTNAATWATVTWIFRFANPDASRQDSNETFADIIERKRLEDIIERTISKIPDYTLFYGNFPMYLTNNEAFSQKYIVHKIHMEPVTISRKEEKIEERREEIVKEEEEENDNPDPPNADGGKKLDEDVRLVLREDEIPKCEKEMAFFQNLFSGLNKVTAKTFS